MTSRPITECTGVSVHFHAADKDILETGKEKRFTGPAIPHGWGGLTVTVEGKEKQLRVHVQLQMDSNCVQIASHLRACISLPEGFPGMREQLTFHAEQARTRWDIEAGGSRGQEIETILANTVVWCLGEAGASVLELNIDARPRQQKLKEDPEKIEQLQAQQWPPANEARQQISNMTGSE
ncbi:hypothetical protein AAY473_037452 [Plecturocebus cupreus]